MHRILSTLLVVCLFCMPICAMADEKITIDEANGLWSYENEHASITITRMEDKSIPLVWYEVDLKLSEDSPLLPVIKNPTSKSLFHQPETMARGNKLVFAVSDDYYGDRIYNKKTPGIIIRSGKILQYKTFKNGNKGFPNLDTMALYPDGSLKVYQSKEYSSNDYIAMGATDVFAFGPILVRDGELNPRLEKEYRETEPRVGFGMIEPYHYFCVVTEGRHENSLGVSCQWLGQKLKEKGAVEALNLDGGQTAALVFMGVKINQTGSFNNHSRIRNISSMIGACVSEEVPE